MGPSTGRAIKAVDSHGVGWYPRGMGRVFNSPLLLAFLLTAGPGPTASGGAPELKGAPEAGFPTVTGLAGLRGVIRALGDGRVELYYNWSDPAQLEDWRVVAGPPPQVADGELRLGAEESHTLRHVAVFIGAVEAAGTWSLRGEPGSRGQCGVALDAAPWRGYWLNVRDGRQELYREDAQAAFLGIADGRFREGSDHTFHFARSGSFLRVWLNGVAQFRSTDAAYHEGAVLLRAWRARAGFRGLWLLGRPAPQWLAGNPGVAAQLEVLRLHAAGVETLRPLWETGQFREALTKATVAAKQATEDAQAVADFWAAVEAGVGRLKPGEAIRVGGAEWAFRRYDKGLLFVERDGVEAPKKLLGLQDSELLALARGVPGGGRAELALAVLRLHGPMPDAAGALAQLAAAQKAGLDVARHRGWLIPRPPTAEKLVEVRRTGGGAVTFAGKPLFIEAEDAAVRSGALEVERDAAASGGRFVWEPREEGQAQYGSAKSRLVFHVLAQEACTVHLWARVKSPTTNNNSFFLALAAGEAESGTLRPWHLAPDPAWHWEPYNVASASDEGSSRPSPLQFQPGVNSLILAVRERGTAVDRLYLAESPDPPKESGGQ